MAVFGALAIGASGLNSQSAALSVIGNNIANVSTTGFKGSRTEFADLLSASGGGELGKIGLGTRVGAVRTLFGQGAIEATGRDKDLAIDGEGFARVDFFLPEDGEPVIIEINTLPGFTPISMFPRLWGLAGIEYGALITKIVELGMARHARDQRKQSSSQDAAKVGG